MMLNILQRTGQPSTPKNNPTQMSAAMDSETLVEVKVLLSIQDMKSREKHFQVFNELFIVVSLLMLFIMLNPT